MNTEGDFERSRGTSLRGPASIDPALETRASHLEGEVRQQNTSIRALLDELKHVEGSQLPSMASNLQNLRSAIERIVASDIPAALRPIEDDANRVRQKFDKFAGETQTKLQNLHERLSETSSSLDQLMMRYQDLSEATRGSVREIDADLQRSRETLNGASQRLVALEGGLTEADGILRSLKSDIQTLARGFGEKVAQFESESSSSFAATAAQLSQELRNEKQIRLQTVAQIEQQIRDVSRNTTEAMDRMTSFLATTKGQYQQALLALSKAANDGLLACSGAVGDGFGQVSERMDQFVNDSNAQFQALEGDLTATIQALKQHIVSAREGLQAAISNIAKTRIDGENDIVERYDQLKATLAEQLRKQAEHIEAASEGTVDSVISHCNETIEKIREELAGVNGQIERITKLENRVSQLNAAAEQTRANLNEQIKGLAEKYTGLYDAVEKAEREFGKRQGAMEERIAALEDPESQQTYATRAELEEVIQRTEAMFDGRLKEIEKQIAEVSNSISDLTQTAQTEASPRQKRK